MVETLIAKPKGDTRMTDAKETFADLENVVTRWGPLEDVGPYTVLTPSRCKECWGGLFGRGLAQGIFSELGCRVCGIKVEGEAATAEYLRISEEVQENALRIRCGQDPEYGEGPFLQKAIVVGERLSEAEVDARVEKKLRETKGQRQLLTRSAFPLGTAGNLYMQAKILIAGVRDVYGVHGRFIAKHDVFEQADGRLVLDMTESAGRMARDPQYHEFEMMGRLGCQMSAAMLAAFACELLMKAISLTCEHAAPKTHDLMELYADLPGDSRRRLEVDYEQIVDVIDEGRHVFGRWRYFENNAGSVALKGMIDLERTLRLAKAARVLLDEATYVGLYGSATMKVKETIRTDGPTEARTQHIHLGLQAGEAPRKTAEPPADEWKIVSTSREPARGAKLHESTRVSWSVSRDEREFNMSVSAGESHPTVNATGTPKSPSCRSAHSNAGHAKELHR